MVLREVARVQRTFAGFPNIRIALRLTLLDSGPIAGDPLHGNGRKCGVGIYRSRDIFFSIAAFDLLLSLAQLQWATFQIMRRTHASLSRQVGIDPKLVADQLGHGLGVNLDVYTVAALHKRQDAVEMLESALARRGSD